MLAVVDPSNPKQVKIFDITSGRPAGRQVSRLMDTAIEHSTEIIQMELNQV